MRKGFIFSMDALFGLTVILLLTISIFLVAMQKEEGLMKASESMRYGLADEALMAFYQHQTAETRAAGSNDYISGNVDEFINDYNLLICDAALYKNTVTGNIDAAKICTGVKK